MDIKKLFSKFVLFNITVWQMRDTFALCQAKSYYTFMVYLHLDADAFSYHAAVICPFSYLQSSCHSNLFQLYLFFGTTRRRCQ